MQTQQVDTAETQLFEDQPFETQVPEIDLTAEQPEQLQAQSLPEGEALDVREGVQPDEVFVDEEPEQADYDDAQPPVGSEALEGKAEKGILLYSGSCVPVCLLSPSGMPKVYNWPLDLDITDWVSLFCYLASASACLLWVLPWLFCFGCLARHLGLHI